jgi:hypothetical protein
MVSTLRALPRSPCSAAGIEVGAGHHRHSLPAGYVVIEQFSVATPVEDITCAAEGTLSLKLSCTDSAGGGATVVVR